MAYWNTLQPSASNLRLFIPREGWKAYAHQMADDGKTIKAQGSGPLVDSALLNALNATNVILLTGAGSSFGATNPAPRKAAPSMADLWSNVRDHVTKARFDTACAKFPDASIGENIEKLLTLCKIYLELHANADDDTTTEMRQFISDAETAILNSVNFVDSNTELKAHSTLVQKIGRRGIRKTRTKVFTTNYDLCFEEAARRQKFVTIDGFSHSLDQTYDRSHFDYDVVRRRGGDETTDYIENVFHLYKLHGSVDWRRMEREIRRSADTQLGRPVLIYPRSSKYQEAFESPYLDMMGALQAALREPDTALIVSGFGFNDEHISRPILSAVEANMSLRLVICDPCFLTEDEPTQGAAIEAQQVIEGVPPTNKFLGSFLRLAEAGDPRIHLMNGRFDDMAVALPDLVGETDRERHSNRIRALSEPSRAGA
ncbi:MAG: SIR2 family protein [Brevundimonas sp.]